MTSKILQNDLKPFSIEFDLDEAHFRLNMILKGQLDSTIYLNTCLAYYSQLPDPGRYDRLIDCRECKGYVDFKDVETLTKLWRQLLATTQRVVRVAVISQDPLTHARMGIVDQLSYRQRHRAFFTVEDAEAWLLGRHHEI